MTIKFLAIMFQFKVSKKKEVGNKTASIQAVLITIFIISVCTVASKEYKYNTYDKFLIEGENNLRYTLATIESIEKEEF